MSKPTPSPVPLPLIPIAKRVDLGLRAECCRARPGPSTIKGSGRAKRRERIKGLLERYQELVTAVDELTALHASDVRTPADSNATSSATSARSTSSLRRRTSFPRPTRDRQDLRRHRPPIRACRPPGPVRDRRGLGRPPREAHRAGPLQAELTRLGRYPLLVVDEVGFIPFEPEAANLSCNSFRPATSGPR
jgi:hypothetical protein